VPMTEVQTQQSIPAVQRYPQREIGRAGDASNGTTLVVLGGVHGNERAGLIAGNRVLQMLNTEQFQQMDGRLIVLAGNLAALNHEDPETRYINHDLNRLCKREHFDEPASTSAEHEQMHELFGSLESILASCKEAGQQMIVLDLHTTSAPSRPVVAFEDSLPARVHAMRMPCPKYLGIEEETNGLVIDAVTARLGCISYLIEGGQHNDPVSIDVHEAAIWIALDTAGVIDQSRHASDHFGFMRSMSQNRGHVVYDVRHREPITSEDFAISEGIEAGTPVHARQTVVAIQAGKPVHSPIHGRVFLPNMQAHKRINDDGFFIVRRVSSGWVNLSAWLRGMGWVHKLIGVMPGVYHGEDSTLLVDGDLACVLRRQVFHLFGYRLTRHDGREGGAGVMRVVNGTKAFLKALFRGPIRGTDGKGPDADDHRFWIVQRRKLDR
jgi:predicted deacylase